ncbi:HdeD family acid-resistance protein [Moellerella wisconsensis]|uniref:HdeD family acid-resistance protein n=1 Tax=Moellerella wisconsensis TaxID=158849 RepID=UPI0030763080
MLNINPEQLSKLAGEQIKKQRTLLYILSFLLLVGGIVCLASPLVSGVAISFIIGIMLLISGVAIIATLIAGRIYNGRSILFSLIAAVAYLILGYVFITDPLQGLLTLAIFVGALFIIGGVFRLYTGFSNLSANSAWMNILIGILDFIIAYLLLSAGAETSIILLTTFIGIELLFTSFTLFSFASLLNRQFKS